MADRLTETLLASLEIPGDITIGEARRFIQNEDGLRCLVGVEVRFSEHAVAEGFEPVLGHEMFLPRFLGPAVEGY